jgi:CheY-like chemotaxis protein
MLAYSGKGRFVTERIDLENLVQQMAQLLEVSTSKKAALRYDFARNVPPIEGDTSQIRQVAMNLITNASEALGESGGTISVATGTMHCDRAYLGQTYLDDGLSEGVYSYLEVSDTGSGMNTATVSKVFEPFFTTKFAGRGLGLAAVLGIVRGHKGAIKVATEPGKGSTFRVLFPAQAPAVDCEHERRVRCGPMWKRKAVLLVDDEAPIRRLAGRMLKRLGFGVVTAGDGRQAVEIFERDPERIACVLLDMTMPEMDGDECLRELRRIREDVPVILSSGYNQQALSHRFAGRGPAGFLEKPYQLDQLARQLEEILKPAT